MHMRTQTISQPSGMEVRPHSRTERTGPYMPGIIIDSGIGHTLRSRDIGPDTDGKGELQRLINKRTQQLKDDRQSLKDHLERYIQLRATQHWTPPTTCLMRDSNLSTHGHVRREYHRPNLWQRRASFIEVHICVYLCTTHSFFSSIYHFVENIFTRIKHFVFFQENWTA